MSDIISARRESVLQSYNSAIADNHVKFLEGDVNATSEYVFPNQIEDANNLINIFYNTNCRVISIQKRTKVGADGLMIELAKLITTHIDDIFVVNPKNVFFLTGMSNVKWETNMINNAPTCFKDRIFHHGKLHKADIMNIHHSVFFVDEIDTGDKECQVLHSMLKDAGILDVHHMNTHNNRFIFISATMIKELYDLYRWGDLHRLYTMTIPPSYIGHNDFLDMGILQECYDLSSMEAAVQWIQFDILNNYNSDYRVHLVRVNTKTSSVVHNACIKNGVKFIPHTSADRISDDNFKELFTKSLTQHIVLGIKGFYRRATLIPNLWKLRIGAIHERCTKKIDNNVHIQGLLGRMTGYWRSSISSGHKTGPYRTSIKAIEEYETTYKDPFGPNTYKTTGFTKNMGKVYATPTMLSPHNILNLKAVDIPKTPEIDNHQAYYITDPYEEFDALYSYLKSIIPIGKIANYTITNSHIQYRGKGIPLVRYTSPTQFNTLDIYAGINKEVKNDNIVCRIMPIVHNNSVKWVGICIKSALSTVERWV